MWAWLRDAREGDCEGLSQDIPLDADEIVIVGRDEDGVVEVDDASPPRVERPLRPQRHVMRDASDVLRKQPCERIENLLEGEFRLRELGHRVERTHQQRVHTAVAQQRHLALDHVLHQLPALRVSGRKKPPCRAARSLRAPEAPAAAGGR